MSCFRPPPLLLDQNYLGLSCDDLLLPSLCLGPLETKICVFSDGLSENAERVGKSVVHSIWGEMLSMASPHNIFFGASEGPRGMFWTIEAHFGPPGTPRKRALFQERGRKRMKEWGEVTFMKKWVKALDKTRILAPMH